MYRSSLILDRKKEKMCKLNLANYILNFEDNVLIFGELSYSKLLCAKNVFYFMSLCGSSELNGFLIFQV